jgi:hypothetical protein
MDKKLTFEVDKFSIIDDYSDSQFAVVEIYVCHDGNNLHDTPIGLDVIKEAKRTLKNKPLLAGFDGKDFKGHEPVGGDYFKNEVMVGVFPESSEMKFVEENGKTFLVAQAIMYKLYAKWAYEVFTKENGRAVSMEITVLETYIDEDDGLEHITKFVFNGVTLLGKKHLPACEGADASIIKFSKENASEVYSKHFKASTDVDNMKCMEISGKEGTETMENEETKNVSTEEVVVTPEVVESSEEPVTTDVVTPENFEEENKTDDEKKDDPTYMEEPKSDESKDDKSKDDEPKGEDKKDGDNKDFSSLTVSQKREVLSIEVAKVSEDFWIEDFDDEYVYVRNYEEGVTYRVPYTISDNTATVKYDDKVQVVRGGYVEFSEKREEGADSSVSEVETLKTEISALKDKLAVYETAEQNNAVETILAEVIDTLPAEKISELREKSKNYSLDNLSAFENEVKAVAFEAVKQTKSNKYSFTRMTVTEIEKPVSKYSWR